MGIGSVALYNRKGPVAFVGLSVLTCWMRDIVLVVMLCKSSKSAPASALVEWMLKRMGRR